MGSVKLTKAHYEILQAAANGRRDTFLPWRGSFGRTRDLARLGLLKSAGMSVVPPYELYVITPTGRAALEAKP